ncbi:MAG: hypothetical protein A2X36_05385 [Elusimicrobia bacterium GWA2_69_24]|nr:MAG: hypothetical protein A2X36_05385 [Elusimicrobia bacterium GWA2_69_24]HBL18738.1 aminoacetone oxidase family FAD-binding enzyme [Elusimicrobiota bacterium]
MEPRIAVVGGGAAGLVAALEAARAGAPVALLERGKALGRKILASGGGRCNLTHRDIRPERYHGGGGVRDLVGEALSGFDAAWARAYFEGLGLMLMSEPDGRVFPRCGRSRAVVDVLQAALNELGADIRLNAGVAAVEKDGEGFLLRLESGGDLRARSVVLCCGGPSYPQLGGSGSGPALAESLGHSCVAAAPALVPLRVKESWVKMLDGIRVEAALRAEAEGRTVAESRGELLFTAYGISGPAALDLSREALRALAGGRVSCAVDLFPEWGDGEFRKLLEERALRFGRRSLAGFLTGMLPGRLPEVFLEQQGLGPHDRVEALGAAGLEALQRGLKGWRFELLGPRPWEEAMVSSGGVSLPEVDPGSLESRKAPGLFLAGELLDVDGDSGGFNLHFAWASGARAGRAASTR